MLKELDFLFHVWESKEYRESPFSKRSRLHASTVAIELFDEFPTLFNRIIPFFAVFGLRSAAFVVFLFRTVVFRCRQKSQRSPNHDEKYHVKVHVHDDNHDNDVEKCVQYVNDD